MATKTAEGVADAGRAAFAALAHLVRRRFEAQPSGSVALAQAAAQPTDDNRVQVLQNQLELAVAEDPEFRRQLGILWQELQPHLIANADGVVNNVSGSVGGHVVQARDIHGGVSFGTSEPT